MIEIFSSWAKGIVLAIVIISILEMLLPNNKTKKYIKMIMGLYLLFNIISPLIKNKDSFSISEFNLEEYTNQTQETSSNILNQESMDRRLNQIYKEELEKDITNKLEQKGYIVENCNVKASLDKEGQTSGIEKIKLKISKDPNKNENEENQEQNIADAENETSSKTSNQNESDNQEDENDSKNNKITIEEKVVEEIQKIKEVKIGEEKNSTEKSNSDNQNEISKIDIKNIKDFLIEEYEVNEKCLEIN